MEPVSTYRPPEFKKSRTGLVIGLTGAAVVAVIIAVVAVVALTGRDRKAGSAPTVSSSSASPTATAPTIDGLLLGADEMDQIMGTTDLLSDGLVTELFDSPNTAYIPIECHGLVTSGVPAQFANSGYSAIREQNVQGSNTLVGEDVLQYASPDAAAKLVDSLAASWDACLGKTVTEKHLKSGTEGKILIEAVETGNHKLFARFTVSPASPNYVCQHRLEPVAAFVVDVLACADNMTNQPETIVSKIAARIRR